MNPDSSRLDGHEDEPQSRVLLWSFLALLAFACALAGALPARAANSRCRSAGVGFIALAGLSAEFAGGPLDDARRGKFLATIPLGRFSTALDVANAALYLASNESRSMTGHIMAVDSGVTFS